MDETNKNDISNSFFNPERDGYLVKQGGRIKTWKRRWFVLTGNCLYYFKDPAVTVFGSLPSVIIKQNKCIGRNTLRHHPARKLGGAQLG